MIRLKELERYISMEVTGKTDQGYYDGIVDCTVDKTRGVLITSNVNEIRIDKHPHMVKSKLIGHMDMFCVQESVAFICKYLQKTYSQPDADSQNFVREFAAFNNVRKTSKNNSCNVS